jgi:hypothetical protein
LKKLIAKRDLPRFGNAREVDNLLSLAQSRASIRPLAPGEMKVAIELEDVCPPDQEAQARGDAMAALDALYNVEAIRKKLEGLRREVVMADAEGRARPKLDHLLFLGNSGTGKTTVASVMAQLLSAPPLGLLQRNYVHMTKASELKGEYVNKAQENVRAAMEAARGGILFIDEAYALGDSEYGKQALEELLTLTDGNPKYSGTVVILAGYEENVHAMLNTNQGLKSRFAKVWHFADWTAEDCAGFCLKQAAKDGIYLEPNGPAYRELYAGFQELMVFTGVDPYTRATVQQPRPGWANARDVSTVYKDMVSARCDRVYEAGGKEAVPKFAAEDAVSAIKGLLMHRPVGQSCSAAKRATAHQLNIASPTSRWQSDSPQQVVVQVQSTVTAPQIQEHTAEQCSEVHDHAHGGRSADDEWALLSQAAQAKRRAELERETQALLDAALKAAADARLAEQALLEEQERERQAQEERDRREREEEERRRREAREQAERENLEREIAAAEILRKQRAAELQRAQEAARLAAEAETARQEAIAKEQRAQQRLRQLGTCPAAYAWIKVRGGYQCAGGSHFVPDSQVNYL